MGCIVFGIDVGGTNTKIGLFKDEVFLEKWEIPTRIEGKGRYILSDIVESLRGKLEEMNENINQVTGIGIGIPGPVLQSGYVVNCVNLNWSDIYPAKDLSRLMNGVPVLVGNDANVAALGEFWEGAGKGSNNLVMVTLGTGVGSGVVLDGKIVYGAKGLSGEIGHISIDEDMTERCNCGNKGCLDQIASATGIMKQAKKMLQRMKEPSELRHMDTFTAKDVTEAAKRGDFVSNAVLEYCMGKLGKCLAKVSYVIDPEKFVIGGGVSLAGEFILDIVKKHYSNYSFLSSDMPKFEVAQLGNNAGIYGAAKIVFDFQRNIDF